MYQLVNRRGSHRLCRPVSLCLDRHLNHLDNHLLCHLRSRLRNLRLRLPGSLRAIQVANLPASLHGNLLGNQ